MILDVLLKMELLFDFGLNHVLNDIFIRYLISKLFIFVYKTIGVHLHTFLIQCCIVINAFLDQINENYNYLHSNKANKVTSLIDYQTRSSA